MGNLVVVLGDQLDLTAPVIRDLDRQRDVVWMAEVSEEATHVWSHKARIALFLSAMRHFRDALIDKKVEVAYIELAPSGAETSLEASLTTTLRARRPECVVMTEPGDYRVKQVVARACDHVGVPLDVREDVHFLCSREEFAAHANGRKQLRMEYFYRELRRRYGVLMDGDGPGGAVESGCREPGGLRERGPRSTVTAARFSSGCCHCRGAPTG